MTRYGLDMMALMHGNDGNARYGARCSFTMLHKVTGFTNVSPKFWCARRTLSSWEVSRPSPLASKASKVCLSTCRGQLSPNMSKHVETCQNLFNLLMAWSCSGTTLAGRFATKVWGRGHCLLNPCHSGPESCFVLVTLAENIRSL